MKFTNSEILALCKILLDSRAFTKHEMTSMLEKLVSCCVPEKNQKIVNALIRNEEFHYVEPRHGTVFIETMWSIGEAIRNCQCIEVEYFRMMDKTVVKRKLRPVAIMFSEYYFYLTAFIDDEKIRKNFDALNDSFPTIYRIDRIKKFKVFKEDNSMVAKMTDYVARGKLREALILGQNLFARNSSDIEIFKVYVFILESAMKVENTSEGKMRYFQQLSATLTVFSENVSIDDAMVRFVTLQEDRLGKLFDEIQQLRKQEEHDFVKKKIMMNDGVLSKLPSVIEKLKTATDKSVFDAMLQQIQQYDAMIDKSYLIERQKELYDSITRQCSKIIEIKLRAFQRAVDAEYNERALAAYERIYQYFKNGKVQDDHKDVINGLFGFDAGRLFNETLVYYNHVYAYILSKLDDDGKFRLTKAAIRSEMRR